MVKVMKFFYKSSFRKRILSMTLAVLMLFSMFAGQLPEGLLEVKAAAETYEVTIHWDNSVDNWDTVRLHSWHDGGDYTGNWPGIEALENASNPGWYDVTVSNVQAGSMGIIFNNGSGTQTDNLFAEISAEQTEVWVSGGREAAVIATEVPEGWKYAVTMHYYDVDNWGKVSVWAWSANENFTGGNWPGYAMTANAQKDGWYDITLNGITEKEFGFLFNNAGGNAQTPDLKYTFDGTDSEIWVTDRTTISQQAPSLWTGEAGTEVKIVSPEVNGNQVTFRYKSESAQNVYLAGSMNNWSAEAEEMTKGEDGIFAVTLTLESGTYQYKFVVDGAWILDPSNENTQDDGYGGSNSVVTVKEAAEIVSPEINGREVTFRYYSDTASSVFLAGSMNEWNMTATPLTKGEDCVFTYTMTLAPGKYEYKFVVDGSDWKQDPANPNHSGDNSAFVVSGLCDGTINATKGEAAELPAELTYISADGTETQKSVTYQLAAENEKDAVLAGSQLTVFSDCTKESFTLTATSADGETAELTVKVFGKQYKYTIYVYSENADRMSADTAALYVWDAAKETSIAAADYEFIGAEKLADGNTWLKTEVTAGFSKKIGFIFKSKGSWSWQTSDLLFENTEKTDCTLYIVDGKSKIYTSLDEIYEEEPEESRYLVVEYTRDDKDYTDTNVYSWGNGYGEEVAPFEQINGKYIAKVPVAASEAEMSVGFIVRKGMDWSDAVKDGGDNFAVIPANQNVVKVTFYDGQVTGQYPYNLGSEILRTEEAVGFYYREDALFLEDKLTSLNGKVQLVVKSSNGNAEIDGTHKMNYDEANARFTCKVPLAEGTDYYYYYLVDGEKVMDAFNEKTIITAGEEWNVLRNKTYELEMSASIKNASMDYHENNLLSVDWTAKEGSDLEGFVVKELYADLTELGIGKMAIDPELKTVSIACADSVSAGTKTIPVVLVDDSAAEYTTTVDVIVKERTKTANTQEKLGDFDWDEAVIYFAVTDRFYDGNSANNTATEGYDAADETDNSRYHGGDLAGLTQKIDYLYELGVNTIWLTPIVDNIDQNVRSDSAADGYESYAYHGYWASDFTSLNPHLGTEKELKALVDAAHAKGMKIMVDVVLNHAGYGAEDTFNSILVDADGNYINMIRGAEETVSGDDKLDSLSGLPDFLTENEEVRNQLIKWQTEWVEAFDIDYYRVDTVKHVDNTTWAAFKNALTEIDTEFKLIGEYYGASYSSTADQLDSGKMDSLLDFGFKEYAKDFVFGKLTSVEVKLAERNESIDNTSTLGSFLSSHDEDGFLYTLKHATEDNALAEGLMKVAATLQITAKGQPVIYYGEEIGNSGANNYPLQENRSDFDWEILETQKADENSLYHHYKKLLHIRRDYSEIFAKGSRGIAVISEAEGYEVISRSYEGKNLYVAMNVKDAAKEATLKVTGAAGSVYTDLYSGKKYTTADNGTITVLIPKATDGGTAVFALTEGNSVVEDTNQVTVKLHYNRPDGDYTDWDVWFWADGMGGNGYEFVEEGKDMVATVTVEGRSSSKVNYIVRKGNWEEKDVDADQSIDISDIVSGTVHFYVNAGVAGGTRILGADVIRGSKVLSSMYHRDTNTVTVEVSTPSSMDKNEAFEIRCTDGTIIDIEQVSVKDCTYTLTLKQDISSVKDVLKNYLLRYEAFDYVLGMPNIYSSEEFESQYTYDGNDLGTVWSKDATAFKVWAPTADEVTLALYKSGTEGTDDCFGTYPMSLGEKGVWSVTVAGDLNGIYYTYLVNVNGETREACDPYARTTGVNGKRAMVLNLDGTDPEGWNQDVSPNKNMEYTDAVIYELHVRDASIHESSGVSEANKGKFLGLTETGTKTAGGVSTVLDHISDLGVTHVHLLPIYDYGSVDETRLDEAQFNWGYDPVNYNVPEGSYSTDPYNGEVRVKEMKEMVMALHKNNINVVMDVVYNHVQDAEGFCFNQIVPKYFSRTYADGSYSSGSGCGNDTASERAMVQKYIVDSVMYWAEEYHIDGFRFDLVGLLDTETMNAITTAVHEKYPDVIFYGEGWTMATETSKDVSMATQQNAYLTPELAYFNDTIRNLLAGDNSAANPGFVSGLEGQESLLAGCVTGAVSWCPNPTQTVNYASCHDNYTLKDKLDLTRADATEQDRIKMNNLTASVYMMSQGIPFIHAGEEFLRTKVDENGKVEHNSYNSSDYVNALRWNHLEDETYAEVFDYYKGLIEFRKNHEALRLTTKEEVNANMSYYQVDNNVVLFTLNGKDRIEGEVSDSIAIIFNATEADKTFSLYDYETIEEGEWKVCINAEDAGIRVLDTITDGTVTVEAISAMVLVKGETEDKDSVYIDNEKQPDKDDTETPNPDNTWKPNPGGTWTPDTDDTEAEDNNSAGAAKPGNTKPGNTKPGNAVKKDETAKEETESGPVEIVISADESIADKTNAIVSAIKKAAQNNAIVIKAVNTESGDAEISVKVLQALQDNREKELKLVIELANGFTWTIDAASVDTKKLETGTKSINFGVAFTNGTIPKELLDEVVLESAQAMELSLKHNGVFGLTAALDTLVGKEFAGRMVSLYYYNTESNTLEAQGREEVDADGNVRFLFTHASDYVMVIEEEAQTADTTEAAETTDAAETTEKNTEAAGTAEDAESSSLATIAVVLLGLVMVIAVVVVFSKKKKAE